MLDEILYKEQLDQVKEYVKKNQYISLTKITEIFGSDTNDELLDDIVEYLDNAGVEITRDSEEVPSEEELMTEIVDDDFEAFVEDLETDDELDELACKNVLTWYWPNWLINNYSRIRICENVSRVFNVPRENQFL